MLGLNDEEAVARMYSDIDVMRYVGGGGTIPKEHVLKSIERWIEYQSKFGFSNWAVVKNDDNKFTGMCGFNWLPDNSDIEISYTFDKPYWGKGYATEIAGGTLKYGFEKLGLKRVAGLVYPQNLQSIKVLKKIGMKYEKDVSYWNALLHLFSVSKPETFL